MIYIYLGSPEGPRPWRNAFSTSISPDPGSEVPPIFIVYKDVLYFFSFPVVCYYLELPGCSQYIKAVR